MIELIITGGQTGADQAGWRAAKAAGIATGGWMPKGFLTEDGPKPGYASLYGAREHASLSYAARTTANVLMADALVWFGNPHSSGALRTLRDCTEANIDHYIVIHPEFKGNKDTPSLAEWIEEHTLMVAGNRESKAPGIGAWVEAYLIEVFHLLRGSL
jgi:hypothetical protein